MSDKVEQLFSNLRRGPWYDSPLGVPQEGMTGNGNVESQGWLSDGSVTADVIQANAVIAGKIDADAVTAREIAADSITASEIAANTITANEIAANTITANEIAANAITASELAANSVTAGKIAANSITATEIAADSITTSELAANAVITENVLASNITSSRIEAGIVGKTYGANSGSAGAPGFYFDSASNYGLIATTIPFWGTTLALISAGTAKIWVAPGGLVISGLTVPGSDNAYGLGASGSRWTDVWAVDGTINTSDQRLKKDIADSPLGLDFVRSLKPRVYRWRDTVDTQARESATMDSDAMMRECRPHEQRIRRIRALQMGGRLSDAEGNARVEECRAALAEIRARHEQPVQDALAKRRPGKRLHFGLIAQEVKASLDAAGVDAAFWKQGPEGEQSLAYSELISPLIAAVRELADRNDDLRSRVAALESRIG